MGNVGIGDHQLAFQLFVGPVVYTSSSSLFAVVVVGVVATSLPSSFLSDLWRIQFFRIIELLQMGFV